MQATDKDDGKNGQLNFKLINYNQNFRINSNGQLQLLSSLDREEKASYKLLVRVEDSGIKPLSSTCTVHLEIQDINDQPPVHVDQGLGYTVRFLRDSPKGDFCTFLYSCSFN